MRGNHCFSHIHALIYPIKAHIGAGLCLQMHFRTWRMENAGREQRYPTGNRGEARPRHLLLVAGTHLQLGSKSALKSIFATPLALFMWSLRLVVVLLPMPICATIYRFTLAVNRANNLLGAHALTTVAWRFKLVRIMAKRTPNVIVIVGQAKFISMSGNTHLCGPHSVRNNWNCILKPRISINILPVRLSTQ